MNVFDDLDDMEQQLGPSLRVALHRAAAAIAGEPRHELHPWRRTGAGRASGVDDATALVIDVRAARAERSGRLRWLFAAAAVAVAVVSVAVLARQTGDEGVRTRTPASPSTRVTTLPTSPGWDALMATQVAAPSVPATGELVASVQFNGRSVYSVYDDGRLVSLDATQGTQGWVEQRLTPEGVERVRSEFLSTGLFDAGQSGLQELTSSRDAVMCVCVRDGQRLLGRNVRDLMVAAPELLEHLRTLSASLPPAEWLDQQAKTFVPSRYAVCLNERRARNSPAPVDPSIAVQALPARAVRTLPRAALDDLGPLDSCFDVGTASARRFARELVAAGFVVDPPLKVLAERL